MGRRLGSLLLLVSLLCLSGCFLQDVQEMYVLPRSAETYLHLQDRVNEAKGNAEPIAPLGGDNIQPIQLIDLDQDGVLEAVAFFREATVAKPLKIAIFKMLQSGDYDIYTTIEGAGSEIEAISYPNLGGGKSCEILVSWRVSDSVHTLVAYRLFDGQAQEMMRSRYSQYITADLDGDGNQEICLVQEYGEDPTSWWVEYYDGGEDQLTLHSKTNLSTGILPPDRLVVGTLEQGISALFISSKINQSVELTDILCIVNGRIATISLDDTSKRSEATLLAYPQLGPSDVNGDGVTEVPVVVQIPSYGMEEGETFWRVDWRAFQQDGSWKRMMSTFHDVTGGWYLELPMKWEDQIAIRRSGELSNDTITFARVGKTETDPQPFLIIRRMTGNQIEELTDEAEGFVLYRDYDTAFMGQLIDSKWDCGLDQAGIEVAFRIDGTELVETIK